MTTAIEYYNIKTGNGYVKYCVREQSGNPIVIKRPKARPVLYTTDTEVVRRVYSYTYIYTSSPYRLRPVSMFTRAQGLPAAPSPCTFGAVSRVRLCRASIGGREYNNIYERRERSVDTRSVRETELGGRGTVCSRSVANIL